ncbi:TIGR03086 family metal-binding protein [Curtobacterium ammoniigenes]|uniref:TIGR03086 family metal-binding protein n=1 Tax=Curtobacterium ammoniigenes TaxID=395387 RepID=UPI00082CD26C|nr:TIGR03086 family metal-binding protein [Curtobacterium ammoniigenes]
MPQYDWFALYRIASEEFGRRVANVEAWSGPTPDAEWSVADLVNHVIGEQRAVPELLARGTSRRSLRLASAESLEPSSPYEGPQHAWSVFAAAASAAAAVTPASAEILLGTDVLSLNDYLAELASDIAIHTWDLARATQQDEDLPGELVEAVWSHFEPQIDSLAASGLYAAPLAVDSEAPLLVRLLAITGRDGR